MSKFICDDSFWGLFPEAAIGVVVLKDLNNSDDVYTKHPEIMDELKNANVTAKKYLVTEPLSECPVIKVWREAFMKFKKKKDNRSSIEALLKRVEKGNEVGKINPLVDIYNATSLIYGLPCGGEDIDSFVGNLRLTISEKGGDEFLALGDEANDPTLPGELCYLDDKGAVCRCWNWRDGQRTMLTEKTNKAFMILECVDSSRKEDLAKALDYLANKASMYLGAKVTAKVVLTKDNKEVEL
jgi:Uncharacterized conserved protein